MRYSGLLLCLAFILSAFPGLGQDNDFDSGRPMSVGLVLSGGGAKGIAHIGVIRALEENNIPIDYIAGTSMGSIVGGLYACGYTTDEMMALILSEDFSYWSTGRIDPSKVYFFSREPQLPTMYNFDINTHRRDSLLNARDAVPASLINPLPMNFAFMDLFARFTAQCNGDFNNLMVPFRCVASDVAAGHKVVHSSGNLGDAIRTSMSFPIVFQPITMNGALLYDGGIFDNFPVDVMTSDFAPDIMLGVDVSASAVGPQTSLMDQIDNLVMRTQTYALSDKQGIKMRINLDEFSLLDFPAAAAIEKIGYEHAVAMMDSIKSRISSRISPQARATKRGVFKSRTPAVVFDRVEVTGGSPRQNQYIKYLFEPSRTDTFGLSHARESYYRAITPGRLKDLFPQAVYNDSTDFFTLRLKASPKDKLSVGVGGYLTSSTNSYLFLNAAWRTLTFSSLNFKLNAWIGQSYMAAGFIGSVNLRTRIPSSVGVTAVVSRRRYYETDQLFYQVSSPTFVATREYYVRGDFSWAASSIGKFTLSPGYGSIYDSYFPTDGQTVDYLNDRNSVKYNLGQLRLSYRANTLDQISFPTVGHEYDFTAMALLGNYRYQADGSFPGMNEYSRVKWIQIESRTRNYWDLSRHFSLGLESDVLFSTKKLHNAYNASIVTAPSYNPTAQTYNRFNVDFHANSFAGLSLVPVYKYSSSLTCRLTLSGFMPFRRIEDDGNKKAVYGKWFSNPEFLSQIDINYAFPFANLSVYGGYSSGMHNSWHYGITFGIFIPAPNYLR